MKKRSRLALRGAVSDYLATAAPKDVRERVDSTGGKPILANGYPYDSRMDHDSYKRALYALQIELAKFQKWVMSTGARVVIVFEGRDAAGKGGTIKRFNENLNPRVARVVALPKPTETEASQWYFQRYVRHLPSAGHIVMFDRSWYNRGVVEKVFGFSTLAQRQLFFTQVPGFERALLDDGIIMFKIWLTIGRSEQLRRFVDRERDPLKHWKLSTIDVDGLKKWSEYTEAIRETFAASHSRHAPWWVMRADDKRRARIAAIRAVLSQVEYDARDTKVACAPDPLLCGGPDLWYA